MLGISFRDPVRTLMDTVVATVSPTATLQEAATALNTEGVGLLVVVDARGVRGVFSERDLVTAVAEGIELDVARVRDHATTELVQVDEQASIAVAASHMVAAEVRHLAISRGGEVVGVISMRDIVAVLASQTELAAIV